MFRKSEGFLLPNTNISRRDRDEATHSDLRDASLSAHTSCSCAAPNRYNSVGIPVNPRGVKLSTGSSRFASLHPARVSQLPLCDSVLLLWLLHRQAAPLHFSKSLETPGTAPAEGGTYSRVKDRDNRTQRALLQDPWPVRTHITEAFGRTAVE